MGGQNTYVSSFEISELRELGMILQTSSLYLSKCTEKEGKLQPESDPPGVALLLLKGFLPL
jgi:hypothetical protein